jgi:hypothetical protein
VFAYQKGSMGLVIRTVGPSMSEDRSRQPRV